MTALPHIVKKSKNWPQKHDCKFAKIKSQILANPILFTKQGSIFATWRKHGNSRLGPYYRLRYFDNGRRRSIYLGRDEQLVQEARDLLARLQSHRIIRRLHAQIRRSLRVQKLHLKTILQANGYRMKGSEIHKIS
jgi:hypothetical protein